MNPISNISNISNQQQINTRTLQNQPMIGAIPGHKPLINTSVESNIMIEPTNPMANMNINIPNNPIPNNPMSKMNANTDINEENKVKLHTNPILKTNTEEDQITNILSDFIKNNNLSREEQKHFYDELKKINKKLPLDKKVVISFEKNNFKFQVLDVLDKDSSKNFALQTQSSSSSSRSSSSSNYSPEIKTYNFDKNMWYISLSSIILTFLIIILLVVKWKESQ